MIFELLKEHYPNVRPEWIDQPLRERKDSFMKGLLEMASLPEETLEEDRLRKGGNL